MPSWDYWHTLSKNHTLVIGGKDYTVDSGIGAVLKAARRAHPEIEFKSERLSYADDVYWHIMSRHKAWNESFGGGGFSNE
tara:strand:- start:138 stop:377 length:240 start_codon:yes stop_codon:yes gene_type:complete